MTMEHAEDHGSVYIEHMKDGRVQITCRDGGHVFESTVRMPHGDWLKMLTPDLEPLLKAAHATIQVISKRDLKSPADCKLLALLREAVQPFG